MSATAGTTTGTTTGAGIWTSTRWIVLAVLAAITYAAAFAALNLVWPESPLHEAVASVLLLLPLALISMATTVAVGRFQGAERKFWLELAVASSALFLGEAVDVVWRMHLVPWEGLLLVAQILTFAIASVFGALAMWYLVASATPPRERIRGYTLDLVVILLSMFLVMLVLVLPAIRDLSEPAYVSDLLFAVYPSILLGIVVFLLVFKRTPWETWQILLAAWVAVLGLRHVVQVMQIAGVHEVPPGAWQSMPTDTLLIMAYVIGFFGVLDRLVEMSQVRFKSHVRVEPVWPSLTAPAVLIALGPILYVGLLGQQDLTSREVFTIMTVAVLIGVMTTVRTYDLALENSSLRRRSTTDALTGLFNHRHFHERLDAEVTRAEREGGSLSVAIMDVDDFDRVNNIYGHAVGDRRLHSIAERLSDSARGSDIVCRVGGDEFAVVMPDTDPIEAYKVCLRLQDEMCEPDGVCPLTTSVSIGIASVPAHARSREELVQKADGALYWAKFHGREQVVIFDADLVQALGPEQRIAMLREEAYLNMVHLLAAAVDARDQYTRRHSANVASLVVALAGDLAFSAQHTAHLETAALLHDIGKIGIPDALLRKESPLSGPERASVAEHPQLATRILSAIPRREILPWIESHHERWDGSGYPIGLAGEDIPLEARMIALCDAYDAMTTDRPYREASSPASARAELLEHAGTQFDPQLTARFVEMLERRHEAPQAHVQGHPVPRPAEAGVAGHAEGSASPLRTADTEGAPTGL